MTFAIAERIADAVLYEGYVLYPYRASAQKNQVRWQFGIIAPRGYAVATEAEHSWAQTECVIDPGDGACIDLRIRLLQVQTRRVEKTSDSGFEPTPRLTVGDRDIVSWDEGVLRAHDLRGVSLAHLLMDERTLPIDLPGGVETETVVFADGVVHGRIVREREPIEASVCLSAVRDGRFIRLRLRIENTTPWPPTDIDRDRAIKQSLVSAHLLLRAHDGSFVSLLEPPDDATDAVARCTNIRTWPVLVGSPGQRDLILSSPIVLYDYPAIAPESPQDLCDGCEIDEILALRVMTLTDDEKREARATDNRARDIIDSTDSLPRDVFERLHGTIRDAAATDTPPALESWEALLNPPGAPAPDDDSIEIGGIRVARGSRVIVRPTRRADPIDLFMKDRIVRVEGVYRDLEGATYIAVVPADDPAGDMLAAYGRFLYYSPDELEPLKENANA